MFPKIRVPKHHYKIGNVPKGGLCVNIPNDKECSKRSLSTVSAALGVLF